MQLTLFDLTIDSLYNLATACSPPGPGILALEVQHKILPSNSEISLVEKYGATCLQILNQALKSVM